MCYASSAYWIPAFTPRALCHFVRARRNDNVVINQKFLSGVGWARVLCPRVTWKIIMIFVVTKIAKILSAAAMQTLNQKQAGEAKEGKKAHHISNSCQHNRAGQRRVDAEAAQ